MIRAGLFAISLAVCLAVYFLYPILIRERSKKIIIRSTFMSIIIYIAMDLLPFFIVLLGGLLFSDTLRTLLFILPNKGLSLTPQSADAFIFPSVIVLSIIAIAISSIIYDQKFSLHLAKKTTGIPKWLKTAAARRCFSLLIFLLLTLYSFGLSDYAYLSGNRIEISQPLLFKQETYRPDQITSYLIRTEKARGGGYLFFVTIKFKDSNTVTTSFYDTGAKVLLAGANLPIQCDTWYAEQALKEEYGR